MSNSRVSLLSESELVEHDMKSLSDKIPTIAAGSWEILPVSTHPSLPSMPSLPSSSNKNEDKSPMFSNLMDSLANVPPEYIYGLIAATSSAILVYRQFGKRIRSSDWVTPSHTQTKKRWIKGVVTRWVQHIRVNRD